MCYYHLRTQPTSTIYKNVHGLCSPIFNIRSFVRSFDDAFQRLFPRVSFVRAFVHYMCYRTTLRSTLLHTCSPVVSFEHGFIAASFVYAFVSVGMHRALCCEWVLLPPVGQFGVVMLSLLPSYNSHSRKCTCIDIMKCKIPGTQSKRYNDVYSYLKHTVGLGECMSYL